jgi:hypothetical protein
MPGGARKPDHADHDKSHDQQQRRGSGAQSQTPPLRREGLKHHDRLSLMLPELVEGC